MFSLYKLVSQGGEGEELYRDSGSTHELSGGKAGFDFRLEMSKLESAAILAVPVTRGMSVVRRAEADLQLRATGRRTDSPI